MPNTAPEREQASVIVLVAAFNSSGNILLLKRPDDVHCGGMWSLPGGKAEDGETPQETAIRELREETGLSGTHWRYLGKASHHYPDCFLKFLLFACFCIQPIRLRAESESVWVPLERLDDYPMPAANSKLLPQLQLPEVSAYLDQISVSPCKNRKSSRNPL